MSPGLLTFREFAATNRPIDRQNDVRVFMLCDMHAVFGRRSDDILSSLCVLSKHRRPYTGTRYLKWIRSSCLTARSRLLLCRLTNACPRRFGGPHYLPSETAYESSVCIFIRQICFFFFVRLRFGIRKYSN